MRRPSFGRRFRRTVTLCVLAALGLPERHFPQVRTSGEQLGGLTAEMAGATGLPAGLPVCAGIGDNQASFVGSVGDPASRDSALSRMRTVVDRRYDVLRELRRQTTIGAAS